MSFKEAFRGNQRSLLDLINLGPGSTLLSELRTEDILTKYQIEAIKAAKTNVEQVDTMLSLLEQKADKLFIPFINALRKSDMDPAADLITQSQNSTPNISTGNTATDAATIRGQVSSSSINSATTAVGNMSVGSVGTAPAYQVHGATGGWTNSSTTFGGTPATHLNFSSGSVQSTQAYQVQDGTSGPVLGAPANDMQAHGASNTRVDPVPRVMYGELQKLKKIGEGGFGMVYSGWHPLFKDVAYKELKTTILQADSRIGRQLKQEAAAHTLRHPNIVIMLAMVFEDGHYGVLFEFVKFGGLDTFVEKYDVGWFGLMSFAGDIARGLTYLHGKTPAPVVHGDIKIQNALVGDGFVAKLCDFGLSKWKVYSTVNTGSKSGRPGTVTHIPPETWENISAQRTVKFDVYSFGILLWELFSHETPFPNVVSNPQLLSLAVQKGERPAPVDAILGEEEPFMPDNMFQLVKHHMQLCWAQKPTDRPLISAVSMEFDRFLQQNSREIDEEKKTTFSCDSTTCVRPRHPDSRCNMCCVNFVLHRPSTNVLKLIYMFYSLRCYAAASFCQKSCVYENLLLSKIFERREWQGFDKIL